MLSGPSLPPLMAGSQGTQTSGHLCHYPYSHVSCITDMCCPDVLQTERERSSVSTYSFISYSWGSDKNISRDKWNKGGS